MGRLAHLRETFPRVVAQRHVNYCLVDYSCPDRSGDWLESEARKCRPATSAAPPGRGSPEHSGRIVVERLPGYQKFNKCEAHNAGARRALREGAEYLCFLDADTIVQPNFVDFVRGQVHPDRFLIAGLRSDGTDMPSMTGLLVVHGRAFLGVGGFDEGFCGWGGEDIELRLRLFLLGGLDPVDVPLDLARPILHGNDMRTQFYDQKNIATSNAENMMRVRRKIMSEWADRAVRPLAAAERLWFRPRRVALGLPESADRRSPKRELARRLSGRVAPGSRHAPAAGSRK